MSFFTVDKQKIKVIDTPGWCDSSQFQTEMKQNIIKFVINCKPHVFLLVLPIGRFTNEEITTVMNILKEFGDEVIKYMIVLFTKGDELEERPIEDYLEELHSDLKKIIQVCGGRYHVFNNKSNKDRQQVSSLLKKMNEIVKKNEEKRYTEATYNLKKKEFRKEVYNSVPENRKRPDENEKRDDDQVSRCDATDKEGRKGEEEALNDSKKLEKLKQQVHVLIKSTQDMDQQKKDIQQLQRELKTVQRELEKTKKDLVLLQKKIK